MRRESYLLQPPKVEVYAVESGTDIILRQNIEEVEKTDIQEEKEVSYKVWECDEVQFRYPGSVTAEEILEKFAYWFAIADGEEEIKAIDKDAVAKSEPTVIERLDALESGLAELAEVMCNG